MNEHLGDESFGFPNGHSNGEINGISGASGINGHQAEALNGVNGSHEETNSINGNPKTPPMPVAIIGMSCRLSGDVSTLEDFWQIMTRSRNGWSEIPQDRFNIDAFYHPNPAKKGTFNAKGGYFLKQDPTLFDAPFFNITQAEAEAMGKRSRVTSQTVKHVLKRYHQTRSRECYSSAHMRPLRMLVFQKNA